MAIFALVSSWISGTKGNNIVMNHEQTVFLSNRMLCKFTIQTIVQTEGNGTWIISQDENEHRYSIDFLLGVTYVNLGLIAEEVEYPRLKIHFHSPSSGQNLLEEHAQTNSSLFDTELGNTLSQLTLSLRAPAKWEDFLGAGRARLEPHFTYDIYHYNATNEEQHILSADWFGAPVFVDVTEPSNSLPSSGVQNPILDGIVTAAMTVLIGVTVYSFGQVISKFLIVPIHKLDEIRGKIADSLVFYASIYANPGVGNEWNKASDQFRKLASLLISRARLVRMYGLLSQLRITPEMSDISEAHRSLIGLSNRMHRTEYGTENVEEANEIRRLLRI